MLSYYFNSKKYSKTVSFSSLMRNMSQSKLQQTCFKQQTSSTFYSIYVLHSIQVTSHVNSQIFNTNRTADYLPLWTCALCGWITSVNWRSARHASPAPLAPPPSHTVQQAKNMSDNVQTVLGLSGVLRFVWVETPFFIQGLYSLLLCSCSVLFEVDASLTKHHRGWLVGGGGKRLS